MRILVPLKRVPDPYAKVKPNAAGTAIDTAGVKFEINPFDEIALEEAVRIKEKDPAGVEIIVACLGPAEAEEQLRKGLAMGADRAILVAFTEDSDSTVVAAELHALVKKVVPDLVLMGKQATDDDNNQAGQMMAAKLGWPQATFASKVDVNSSSVDVTRETDSGTETLRLPLPCVITADLRLNEPRYIALPGIIKARSKPLTHEPRATAAAPKTRVTKLEATPARSGGQMVGSIDELLAALRATGAAI